MVDAVRAFTAPHQNANGFSLANIGAFNSDTWNLTLTPRLGRSESISFLFGCLHFGFDCHECMEQQKRTRIASVRAYVCVCYMRVFERVIFPEA